MISWLESVVKEKVEKMIEQQAQVYIEQYVERSLQNLFQKAFSDAITSQVGAILKANEKKIAAAMDELNDIDSLIRTNSIAAKEKIRTQFSDAMNKINFDIVMTPENNAVFSGKVATIIHRMIMDNPGFITQIAKTKLAERLGSISLFGEPGKQANT